MITEQNYYNDKSFVSNSMLNKMNENQQLFYEWINGTYEYPSTNALDIGTAIHLAILEPEKIESSFFFSQSNDGRTKEFKNDVEDNPDKIVLKASDWQMLSGMRDAFLRRKMLSDIVSKSSVEQIATKTINGVACKGKADIIYDSIGKRIGVDYKTTSSSIDDFLWTASKYNYDRQAWMYMQLFDLEEFWFIVQEKYYPFRPAVIVCGNEFLQSGSNKLDRDLDNYKKFFLDGEYDPNHLPIVTLK
jgi:exodeoxyribonuclease VIII